MLSCMVAQTMLRQDKAAYMTLKVCVLSDEEEQRDAVTSLPSPVV